MQAMRMSWLLGAILTAVATIICIVRVVLTVSQSEWEIAFYWFIAVLLSVVNTVGAISIWRHPTLWSE